MLKRLIRCGLLGCIGLAAFGMLFVSQTETGFVEPISVLLLMMVLYMGFRPIFYWLSALTKQKLKWIIGLALILTVAIAILVVTQIRIQLFGDIWHIQIMAAKIAAGNFKWDEWILQYPQLVPLTYLYSIFVRLGNGIGFGFYPFFYAYNIILMIGTIGLVIHILWRRSPAVGAFSAIVALVTPLFYSFMIQVGYTDGASIFVLVLLVDLFDQIRLKWQQILLVSLAFSYAYLMRPNVIIFLVALLIIGGFSWKKNPPQFKKTSQMFVACLIGIFLAIGTGKVIDQVNHYNPQNKDAYPTVHWIYMGLNQATLGEYNSTDRYYTLDHKGYSTANAADLAGIEKRLSEYNPVSLLAHWYQKYLILWKSGSFQMLTDYQGSYITAPGWLLQNNGTFILLIQTYSKALMGLFLLAMLLDFWRKKQLKINSILLSLLTIFGISLFHTLLWEVKTRYQFMTFGLIFLVGILSLTNQIEVPSRIWQRPKVKAIVLISLPMLILLSSLLMGQYVNKKVPIQITGNNNLNNYKQSSSQIRIPAHESIEQGVTLNADAATLILKTGADAPLDLKILSNKPDDQDVVINREILPQQTQLTIHNLSASGLPAGQYIIQIENKNSFAVTMTGQNKVYVSLYPSLITMPQKQQSSFVFYFYGKKVNGSYNLNFIVSYIIIVIIMWLFLIFNTVKTRKGNHFENNNRTQG
ncbi:hypothetical protein [Lactococcus fujiensis]|nr:hypothetical protein [Lactococcus fujiensis]